MKLSKKCSLFVAIVFLSAPSVFAESGTRNERPQEVSFGESELNAKRKRPSFQLVDEFKTEAMAPSFEWHFMIENQIEQDVYGLLLRRLLP